MFNFSQSLFVLSFLLHLMPSVTVGVSIGGRMRIEDSHIKIGVEQQAYTGFFLTSYVRLWIFSKSEPLSAM